MVLLYGANTMPLAFSVKKKIQEKILETICNSIIVIFLWWPLFVLILRLLTSPMQPDNQWLIKISPRHLLMSNEIILHISGLLPFRPNLVWALTPDCLIYYHVLAPLGLTLASYLSAWFWSFFPSIFLEYVPLTGTINSQFPQD